LKLKYHLINLLKTEKSTTPEIEEIRNLGRCSEHLNSRKIQTVSKIRVSVEQFCNTFLGWRRQSAPAYSKEHTKKLSQIGNVQLGMHYNGIHSSQMQCAM
jgi:hypothetical protein